MWNSGNAVYRHVVGAVAHEPAGLAGQREVGAVAQHRPLGWPGGARGVEDHGGVAGLQGRQARCRLTVERRQLVHSDAGAERRGGGVGAIGAVEDDVAEFRQLRHHLGQPVGELDVAHHRLRAGLTQHVGEAVAPLGHVDGHVDDAGAGHGEPGVHAGHAVTHDDGGPVAGPQAYVARQAGTKAVGVAVERGIRLRLAHDLDRLPITAALGTGPQPRPDGHRTVQHWIPAFAGMTSWVAGMTSWVAGMTS